MGFKAENETALTDEMLDAIAREYGEGTWEGRGRITAGRPKLYDEDMGAASLPLPREDG